MRNTFPLVWLGLMPTPSVAVGRAGCVGGQLGARARRGSFVSIKGRETRKERAHAPLVMMALVAAGTLNSSAAYLSTAVNGASSGTLSLFGKGAGMEV